MPSRKDQLHSYQFMMQRVFSSIMTHETDPEQVPLRRGIGAVFGGVMVAGLITVIFALIGVFTSVGGIAWRAEGELVIERETGAAFVYNGDALQPALNYASARLISQGANGEPHRVSGKDLADLPRNVAVGIPGAPDSLPEPDRAVRGPWSLCSTPGVDASGTPITTTTLVVGERVAGGVPLGERGVLVRDDAEDTYHLIWRSHRYRIGGDDPENVVRSLYGVQQEVARAGTAWLNGLPVGQDIGPIDVPDRGEPSTAAPDWQVGDVLFHSISGGRQHYLVRDDGFAPVTELQVRILEGQYPLERTRISALAANDAPSSDPVTTATGETSPPKVPPTLVSTPSDEQQLCAVSADATANPRITIGGDGSALAAGIATGGESRDGTPLADRVLVPPGSIAVVRALPTSSASSGPLNLVTDLGIRFPVPSEEELSALGYGSPHVVNMPAMLVQRIPEGPTLSTEAAMRPAAVPSGTG